jgi:hypothetical protein
MPPTLELSSCRSECRALPVSEVAVLTADRHQVSLVPKTTLILTQESYDVG